MGTGEETANRILCQLIVVQNGSGEGERALGDAIVSSFPYASFGLFHIELVLQGVDHRLDELAECLQEAPTVASFYADHCRENESGSMVAIVRFILGAVEAIYCHNDAARPMPRHSDFAPNQVTEQLVLVITGDGHGGGHRRPGRRAREMVSKATEVARMTVAVVVAAMADEEGALGGFPMTAAHDPTRVDERGVIEPALGLGQELTDTLRSRSSAHRSRMLRSNQLDAKENRWPRSTVAW